MHMVRAADVVLVVVATAGRAFAADGSRLEQEFVAARELVASFCHACAKGDPATARGAYDESTPQGTVGAALAARFANDVAEYRDLEDMACDKFGPPGVAAVRELFQNMPYLERLIAVDVRHPNRNLELWQRTTDVFLDLEAKRGFAYNELLTRSTWLLRKDERWYLDTEPPGGRETALRVVIPLPDRYHYLPIDTISQTKELVREYKNLSALKNAVEKLRAKDSEE